MIPVLHFDEVNEEILYSKDPVTKVDKGDIDFLKGRSIANKRRRIRLCVHPGVDDSLHEMLIVHHAGNYVPPHRHPGKSESFHMIEGALKIVLFDADGAIFDIIDLDASGAAGFFYYRLSESLYHTVIPVSDVVVFHETTNGPFRREDMLIPEWAPEDGDEETVIQEYMTRLNKEIDGWYAVRRQNNDE